MTDKPDSRPQNPPGREPPPKPTPPNTVSIKDGIDLNVLVRIK